MAKSWLFIKDNQSIWVERPYGYTLIVAGPGSLHREHHLSNEEDLQTFQTVLAEQFVEAGWFLWGFDRERRERLDRRAASRGASDRRMAAAVNHPTGHKLVAFPNRQGASE